MDQRKSRTLKAYMTDAEYQAFQTSIEPVTQVEAVRAIALWFSGQDEVTRKAILDLLPRKLRPDIARIVLEQLAKPRRGKPE